MSARRRAAKNSNSILSICPAGAHECESPLPAGVHHLTFCFTPERFTSYAITDDGKVLALYLHKVMQFLIENPSVVGKIAGLEQPKGENP